MLRASWDRLPTRRAIAERLDRSLEAVKRRCRHQGLPRRDKTPRQWRLVRETREAQNSWREVLVRETRGDF